MFIAAYVPVSYTHLDVYKRQPKMVIVVAAMRKLLHLVYGCLLYTSRCV